MAYIQKVAIIGASGRIGKHFAEALVASGKQSVTAITREGTGALPSGVASVKVDYEKPETLVEALEGQELLIITLGARVPPDLHGKIVEAAGAAGVKWIIPSIFGYDTDVDVPADEQLFVAQARGRLEEVRKAGMSYIVLSCGFWYEWSLALGKQCYGIEIKERKATLFDDGTVQINTSTWPQCGRALAALLSLPESGASPSVSDWKNKYLYFDSFKASQREMLDSVHRALGTSDKDWEIVHQPSRERYDNGLAGVKNGDMLPFAQAMYARVFFPGGAGLTEKKGLANEVLGLPKEDLDKVTKEVVERVEGGWTPW